MTFDEFSKTRGIPRSTLHYMLSTGALKSDARKIATRKGVRRMVH